VASSSHTPRFCERSRQRVGNQHVGRMLALVARYSAARRRFVVASADSAMVGATARTLKRCKLILPTPPSIEGKDVVSPRLAACLRYYNAAMREEDTLCCTTEVPIGNLYAHRTSGGVSADQKPRASSRCCVPGGLCPTRWEHDVCFEVHMDLRDSHEKHGAQRSELYNNFAW